MSTFAFAPPEPRVLRTTTEKCRECGGRGCDDCGQHGTVLVEFVACPEHGVSVARNAETGALLGRCDRCMGAVATALPLMNTTGRVDFPLAQIVDAARQEQL